MNIVQVEFSMSIEAWCGEARCGDIDPPMRRARRDDEGVRRGPVHITAVLIALIQTVRTCSWNRTENWREPADYLCRSGCHPDRGGGSGAADTRAFDRPYRGRGVVEGPGLVPAPTSRRPGAMKTYRWSIRERIVARNSQGVGRISRRRHPPRGGSSNSGRMCRFES